MRDLNFWKVIFGYMVWHLMDEYNYVPDVLDRKSSAMWEELNEAYFQIFGFGIETLADDPDYKSLL